MDAESILRIAMKSGKVLLSSGAETYRVEGTIKRILSGLGACNPESFVTQGGIFISFEYDNQTHTKVIRNTQATFNLYRINRINQISRDLCASNIDIEVVEELIDQCANSVQHSANKERCLAAIIAASFTIFYGGNLIDALWALLIGYIMKYVYQVIIHRDVNNFVTIGISSLLITLLTYMIKLGGANINVDSIIIGTAMNLVPGLAITNAIRDSFEKDYLSGLTRSVEAFLIALAMALGAGFGMSIVMYIVGGTI